MIVITITLENKEIEKRIEKQLVIFFLSLKLCIMVTQFQTETNKQKQYKGWKTVNYTAH